MVQIAALLSGFNYGIMYTEQYHESIEISGLNYIACALGELVASRVGGSLMDYLYTRRQHQGRHQQQRQQADD
ncbi:hypothetical protein SPI_08345 [Niveomyces insectorum RCEF 264]|uniref:Uncharacterized protein n=1 Tax=Niveomyces insectorum RCEF 264 TaxID=1081102 RepID=A0A162MF00_9HYPO|nr:hypothetical protein SPI_08345 [Niveomyces insectorum RCEF 264]